MRRPVRCCKDEPDAELLCCKEERPTDEGPAGTEVAKLRLAEPDVGLQDAPARAANAAVSAPKAVAPKSPRVDQRHPLQQRRPLGLEEFDRLTPRLAGRVEGVVNGGYEDRSDEAPRATFVEDHSTPAR